MQKKLIGNKARKPLVISLVFVLITLCILFYLTFQAPDDTVALSERVGHLSVVEDLMKLVKRNVAAGDSVYLRGFGVFQSRLRRAKVGRNITKGEQLSIPAKRVPQFRPYPHFKKLVEKNG